MNGLCLIKRVIQDLDLGLVWIKKKKNVTGYPERVTFYINETILQSQDTLAFLIRNTINNEQDPLGFQKAAIYIQQKGTGYELVLCFNEQQKEEEYSYWGEEGFRTNKYAGMNIVYYS